MWQTKNLSNWKVVKKSKKYMLFVIFNVPLCCNTQHVTIRLIFGHNPNFYYSFFLTRSIRRNDTVIGSRFYASVQHNDPTSASHYTGPNLCNGVTTVMEGNRSAITPIRTKRPRFVRVFVFLFFFPPPPARFLPVHFWSIFRTTRNRVQTMGEGDSISGIYIRLTNTDRSHNTLCECVRYPIEQVSDRSHRFYSTSTA